MENVSRRGFISGATGLAAVAIAGLPTSAPASSTPAVRMLPAWDVGSGEMDWRVIFAETAEDAKKIWYEDYHGENPDEPCSCGCGELQPYCTEHGEGLPEARRAPHWDNPENAEPSWIDCYNAGWTTLCDRCGNEVNREDGDSDVMAGSVVCHECMTDDELRSVRPDHRRFDADDDV